MAAFAQLFKDPPPAFAFELSEAGMAWSKGSKTGFEPFAAPVLTVSPVHDNVQDAVALERHIKAVTGEDARRRARTVLLLPDYAARVAVLDFDAFPSSVDEQSSLLRFRMKKSVPFDIETAVVSHYAQPRAAGKAGVDVIAAVIAREIVTRYEAPFRAAGLHPGLVTTAALAMLQLVDATEGVTIAARLNGRTLTVIVMERSTVRLVRCVEMSTGAREEIEGVLVPTLVYVEDELETRAERLLLCGFAGFEDLARTWAAEWSVQVERLQSRFGAPTENNAGLLGYLESV